MLFGLLGSVLPLGLLVLLIVAVLSGRYEPDPARERPRAVYLAAASFLGIFTLLGAAFMVISSLLGLTTDSGVSFAESRSGSANSGILRTQPPEFDEDGNVVEDESEADDGPGAFDFEETLFDAESADNRDIAGAVGGTIVGLIALGIALFHYPKLRGLVRRSIGPATRVYTKYLYLVCFIAVVIVLGAGTFALFSLFGVAAPGVADVASRSDAARDLASAAVLAVGAALVFLFHWRRADEVDTAAGVALGEPLPPAAPAVEDVPPTRGRIVRRTPPSGE